MNAIMSATLRSHHQGVMVTISLRHDRAGKYVVRCQPSGYPWRAEYDRPCASWAEAERVFTAKYNIAVTGEP